MIHFATLATSRFDIRDWAIPHSLELALCLHNFSRMSAIFSIEERLVSDFFAGSKWLDQCSDTLYQIAAVEWT